MTGIPDEAFDDLMLRWLAGNLDQLEERRLANWLQSSPEHRRRFEQAATIWSLAPPRCPEPTLSRPDPTSLVRRAESRRIRTRFRRRLITGSRIWAPAAAAAALLLITIVLQMWRSEPVPVFGTAEFMARDGGDASLRLDDGSSVHLGEGSTLRLEPHPSVRQVFLRGRAYFSVAEDEARPFVVRTAAGEARVLGTQFEIRVEGDRLRLSVVDGRVALASTADTVEINAGEVSYAQVGATPEVFRVDDIHGVIEGRVAYRSLPLKHVAQDLELQFRRGVEIADSVLAARLFTGSFADEPFEDIIDSICRAVAAECTWTASGVVMMSSARPARQPRSGSPDPGVDPSSKSGGSHDRQE